MLNLLQVFFSPAETFKSLNRKTRILPAFLLVVLVMSATTFVFQNKVSYDAQMKAMIEYRESTGDVIPEDIKAEVLNASQSIYTKVGAYLAIPIGLFVACLLMAITLQLLNTFITGRDITMERSLAICIYATMAPFVVYNLITIVVMITTPEKINILHPYQTFVSDLSVFLSDSASKFIRSAVSAVDIFGIWRIALLVIGLNALSKTSREQRNRSLVMGSVLFILFGAIQFVIRGVTGT